MGTQHFDKESKTRLEAAGFTRDPIFGGFVKGRVHILRVNDPSDRRLAGLLPEYYPSQSFTDSVCTALSLSNSPQTCFSFAFAPKPNILAKKDKA
jgi:hypothetical protein